MYITEKIEKYLKEGDAEYKAFFNKKLKEHGVDSIDDLSDEDKNITSDEAIRILSLYGELKFKQKETLF